MGSLSLTGAWFFSYIFGPVFKELGLFRYWTLNVGILGVMILWLWTELPRSDNSLGSLRLGASVGLVSTWWVTHELVGDRLFNGLIATIITLVITFLNCDSRQRVNTTVIFYERLRGTPPGFIWAVFSSVIVYYFDANHWQMGFYIREATPLISSFFGGVGRDLGTLLGSLVAILLLGDRNILLLIGLAVGCIVVFVISLALLSELMVCWYGDAIKDEEELKARTSGMPVSGDREFLVGEEA